MKKIYAILFIGLMLSFSACEKFLDVNTDPNNPATAPYSLVFPAGTVSSASVYGGDLVVLGSIWAQHFTQSNVANQYKNIDSYNLISDNFDAMFREAYAGGLNDLHYVIVESEKAEDWNTYLMATVLQCFTFQYIVDLYGQIPYSEAFKGVENLAPKYDDGQAIYDDLIVRIDAALAKDFDAKTNTNIDANDMIFGGKMARWKEFANSLKLKIYLRQTKIASRQTTVNAGLTSCLAAPLLAVDAKLDAFSSEIGKMNPYYGSDVDASGLGGINLKASKTLYTYLSNKGDARRTLIYKPGSAAGTTFNALLQGDFNAPSTGATANNMLAIGLFNANDPVYFMSAAEVEFMIAEAKLRLGVGGEQADYEAGILASYTKFKIPGSAASAISGSYAYPASGTFDQKLAAIITQKWIASALSQPIEGFFDYNRTGYPNIFTSSVESVLAPGKFPKRLLFPRSEHDRNPNTPAQVAIDVPVWWAAN
jgi:hypothetical protein